MTYTEKLENSEPASWHELDLEKAKRFAAKSMYVPSASDVLEAIQSIPFGKTLTTSQIRQSLAAKNAAETTCPFKVNQYWKWLAFAAEEEAGAQLPWWRLTKDGKPYDKLPGGQSAHQAKLSAER